MADYQQVENALSFIPSDDREVWVNVGNALKAEFGGNGLDLWLHWSYDSSSFNKKSAMSVWKSFKKLVVPIGYVFKLAISYGYVPEKTTQQKPSKEQLAERKAKQAAAQLEEEKERQENAQTAVQKSKQAWATAKNTGESLYLDKKCVRVIESIRYAPAGAILIPMIHYDRPHESAFVGVQTIEADGTKLFPAGVEKSGSACRLGDFNPLVLAICEGYATGCSLRFGFDYKIPLFVAFDAGNLFKVAIKLRKIYPKTHLIICADNDQKTKGNPGITWAKKALKEIAKTNKNVSIIYPIFEINDKKSSDFNDLFCVRGARVLKDQLSLATQRFYPVSEAK